MIVPVREKINIAIQDMPAVDDVANLLRGTCLLFCIESPIEFIFFCCFYKSIHFSEVQLLHLGKFLLQH